ncbi:hypothetical protein A3843_05450 [Pseudovibrio exalbescens]|uniref:Transcription factor LuxR-like autoinducer-binding domain-containing protein n=2 Tax=Pseudovibrio exalbescens TaxID=197461 RepID=A0A1U7JK53_9HYPH|nr:hypothetical protein A3843_05450 [Pseudovibrio exalbescens]
MDNAMDENFKLIAYQGYAIGKGRFTMGEVDLETTYSAEWQSEYFAMNGLKYDPVVIFGLNNTGLIEWQITNPNNSFLSAAYARDIKAGIAFSSCIGGNRLIAGVARTKPFSQAEKQKVHQLLTGYHLEELCNRTLALQPLQKELIQLASSGHKAKEIAHHFRVSEDAIKQRKKAIQRHIGVDNFATVVALAARAGFGLEQKVHQIN